MSQAINGNLHKAEGINIRQLAVIAALGLSSSFNPITISVVWAFVVLACLYGLFFKKIEYVWYAIAASPFLEVWGRMVKRAPFVPMEMGKYFLVFAILLLFYEQIIRNKPARLYSTGMLIIVFLLPSLLVNLSGFSRDQWVFNVLSILQLSLLLIITARERWDIERFCRTVQVGLTPIIAILIFLSLRTPNYANIDFSLSANKAASGGFGSNQVSTILGMGIVFTVLLMLLKRPLFSVNWANYALLGYLLFRGLLTFSRGGMVVAALAVFIAAVPIIFTNMRSFVRNMAIILIIIGMGFVIFSKVNDLTGNQLLLRYEGETKGTATGSKDKTINTVTSGREVIFMADIDIFENNPIFGVGPGGAVELRYDYGFEDRTAAHIEYTRLLSEHGIGGLCVIFVMLIFPIVWIRKQRVGIWRGVSAGLFTIGILTCLHSAMRTNTTVVCYTLAAIPVMMNKRWMEQLKYKN